MNSFYVDGRKLTIDQVDLTTAQTELWRLCPNCSHAQQEVHGQAVAACPQCSSPAWADSGQLRSMLKVHMVYSNDDWKNSLIGDDSDDRSTVFYTKQMLVDVDEAHDISKAYRQSNQIGQISRKTAISLLRAIISGKDNIEEIPMLGNIPVNSLFESELECRFIEALDRIHTENGSLNPVKALVNGKDAVFPRIVIDEGQDLSPNAYRLLRVLPEPEHQNDLFIVGDTHQLIYKNKATLSKCGINVRGRSSYLKINYRTTEEIRKYAFALLKGISFDDLDEDYDDGKVCQSLTHGDMPTAQNFKDAAGECAYIVSEIKALIQSGVDAKSICVVARTHKLLKDCTAQLTQAGLRVYEIKRSKVDDRNCDGIRVFTMPRVKGLEFSYTFFAAVNKCIVLLASAINRTDVTVEAESITAEKCRLYVTLTRAQKRACITCYGTASEFLE